MGQTLSEPVVDKHSDEGQDDRVAFGVSAMQGWRISMEDAHATILDLQPHEGEEELKPAASDVRISYFGVYDGHGGDKVALYTGEHLHKIIAKQESFKNKNFEQALKDGFLAIDRAILSDPRYEEEVSGCTSTVGIITHDKIYCGNAGDSRTVLGIKGRAKPLSFDHKPQNEGEKARICAAGGFVDFGRVNGNLALSRAIGDFEFKKSADLPPEQQIVTAFPEVTVHELGEDDEFLVVACDGIWDCQSSQAVVEFVRRGIAAKQELHSICENMMDNCLASNSETGGVGCDNMTMVVVALLNGKSKEEWYKMIGERVANGDGPCAPPEYAEFRGPGMHHRFDDSPDDYEMDMDQRTRMLGRGGRIILLGDGTEIVTGNGDGDVEMNEGGRVVEEEDSDDLDDKDLEELLRNKRDEKGVPQDADREVREGTPAPASGDPAASSSNTSDAKPEDPKTTQAADK
ncbi:unnamed protein product [Zymoseptoria tritici ST99CH_1A5]|uniref:Protein phosphatase 2C homolog 2 n=3 Tax=Zymoseptoria tritici TaxID=1047171 RepID=F9XNH4_ZYMTI|nr:protein phosphatase 2C protein 1 [Zymoseptoria tritici IPO323]EGP82873.1 protein phosphatase 2C protein 1 [Zymoseptoria tritici IPO323]SMR60837.1 unnamed protein product [Zymoseptoria tritici ST99CH_1E4]SMR63977.1 unnamed protein product [Zymoseptoria tritici ST99CH_3D1]SMY29331.1 unnamed protein product [Zymoseptoria tritici ST99CH_1A5]